MGGDAMLYYVHNLPVLLDSCTMRKSAWMEVDE